MGKKHAPAQPRVLKTKPPKTLKEAERYIEMIGDAVRSEIRCRAALDEEIEKVRAQYQGTIDGYRAQYEALVQGLRSFAEANRPTLTNDGKLKTVKFPTGIISWRVTNAVEIEDPETVVAELEKLGLGRFIESKVVKSLKKGLLKDEEQNLQAIKGITFEHGENFAVKPAQTEGVVSVCSSKEGLKIELKLPSSKPNETAAA